MSSEVWVLLREGEEVAMFLIGMSAESPAEVRMGADMIGGEDTLSEHKGVGVMSNLLKKV